MENKMAQIEIKLKKDIEYYETLIKISEENIDEKSKKLDLLKKELQNKMLFKAIREQMEKIEDVISSIEKETRIRGEYMLMVDYLKGILK